MKNILVVIVLLLIPYNLFASNKASQVDFLISGLVNSSGNPLTSGKVYFYTAGSYSNLKTIWTDKDKTTTAANPVTLDAYGKKPIFADGFYNIEVQNSSSATLYKIANVWFGHVDATTYDPQDYTDMATTINAISSTNSTLEIRSSIDIGTNTTIPPNVKLRFFKGGQLNKTASCTVTINGSIEAEPDEIFNGFDAGDVVFNDGYVREVYPQWWGFSEAATLADNTTAMNCAIRSQAKKIFIPEGTYSMNEITLDRSVDIECGKSRAAVLYFPSGITSPVTINDAVVKLKNLEMQYIDTNAIGITISGTSSGYSLDTLYLNHPAGASSGSYGVFINASEEVMRGEIKDCTIIRPYYGVYAHGAYANSRVFIEDNIMEDNTYCVYDAGSSTNWIVNGNRFIDFTKLGVHTKCQGVTINDNIFDINPRYWDTFTGAATTNNPIMMGTNSTRLSAYGNVFLSGGTETTDRGKLFWSNSDLQGAYYFSDPWDGIRTDAAQRWYGGQILQGISVADKTLRINQMTAQTGNMVEYQDVSGNVIAGVNKQGNPFETMKTISSVSGKITIDCAQGSTFYCDLTEDINTVTINNASDGINLRLALKQGAGSYNIERSDFQSNVKFNNNTYSLGATNNKIDILSFIYFGTATGLNVWMETSRTSNIPE